MEACGATAEFGTYLQGFVHVVAHGEFDFKVIPEAELRFALDPCETGSDAAGGDGKALGTDEFEPHEGVYFSFDEGFDVVEVVAADFRFPEQAHDLRAGGGKDELVPEMGGVLMPGFVFFKELQSGSQLGDGEIVVLGGAGFDIVDGDGLGVAEFDCLETVFSNIVGAEESGDHDVVHATTCSSPESLNSFGDGDIHVSELFGVEFIIANGFGEDARPHGTAQSGGFVQNGFADPGGFFLEIKDAELVEEDDLSAEVPGNGDVIFQPGSLLLEEGPPFVGVFNLIVFVDCCSHN